MDQYSPSSVLGIRSAVYMTAFGAPPVRGLGDGENIGGWFDSTGSHILLSKAVDGSSNGRMAVLHTAHGGSSPSPSTKFVGMFRLWASLP
jgi:hypothetical protein